MFPPEAQDCGHGRAQRSPTFADGESFKGIRSCSKGQGHSLLWVMAGMKPTGNLQLRPSLRPWKPLSWQLLLGSLHLPALGSQVLSFYAVRKERQQETWGGSHFKRQKDPKYGGEEARKDYGSSSWRTARFWLLAWVHFCWQDVVSTPRPSLRSIRVFASWFQAIEIWKDRKRKGGSVRRKSKKMGIYQV